MINELVIKVSHIISPGEMAYVLPVVMLWVMLLPAGYYSEKQVKRVL
jgi:hypothetical protein